MGRKKIYHKRYLIGLDKDQAENLESLSKKLDMTYSDIISYFMDLYELDMYDHQK